MKYFRIDDPRMMTLLSVALGVDFEGASEENQFTNQKGNNQQTPPPQSESTSSTAQKKEHQSNANAKSRKEPEPMEVDENLTEEQKQVTKKIRRRALKSVRSRAVAGRKACSGCLSIPRF